MALLGSYEAKLLELEQLTHHDEKSKERAAMVNLHRWLKRTSPHFVIAGSLAITGLVGCRSAQYTAVEVEAAPAESTYPAPLMVPEALPEAVTQAAPYFRACRCSTGSRYAGSRYD